MSDTEYLCKDCKHSYINPLAKIGSYVFDFRKPGPNWYSCLRSPDPARVEFNSVTGQHSIKKIVPFCELEIKYRFHFLNTILFDVFVKIRMILNLFF